MDRCPPEEDIVRGILEAHYDATNKRISSALFKGNNNSVNRLSVWNYEWTTAHFKKRFGSKLYGTGTINIGKMEKIGVERQPPLDLPVVPETKNDPENPAHAEIRAKVSQGLSTKIRDACEINWMSSLPLEDLVNNKGT